MKRFFGYKNFFVLLLSALFLFCATACSNPQNEKNPTPGELTEYENTNETPKDGGVLRLALIGAQTLNPILAENENNLYVLKLIYDGLFRTTPTDLTEPVLCESYSISPDGLSYELTLKSGVSFHDGSLLTAADADATLSLLLASEGIYQNRLSCIASHHSRDMTLYITLKYPVINFTALLDFPILPAESVSTPAVKFVPNGTGRYKVQSYKQNKELYLSVNENYHMAFTPHIPAITVYLLRDAATAVSMLENLQIDLLPSQAINLDEYTPKRSLASAEFSGGSFTFIGMNNQHPAFLSANTRNAVKLCINQQAIMDACTILYADVAELPVHANSFWYNSELPAPAYNPENARNYLLDDGWSDTDGDGVPDKLVYGEKTDLSVTVLVNEENQTRKKIAEQVCRNLRDIGFVATLQAVPFETYREKISTRAYDIFVGEVSFSANYDLSFLLKTDQNYFGFSSERADQSLNALPLLESTSQKQQLFYELMDAVQSEVPFVGVYFENHVMVFDKRLSGAILPAASDLFYSIDKWFLTAQ